MLQAKNITVRLGKKDILHGVDFTAKPGELTAIVGPNGSGKTTLLRAMTGDVAYGGDVLLNGQNIETFKAWELAAQRAVLPQASALSFPFTVIEVVRIGLQTGTSGAARDLPMQALSRVGLAHMADRFVAELSGGQQQRVHLARVLTQVWHPVYEGQPRWLFLDEPVASLDIGHQLQVMDIAKDYAARGGGVIAVMHDLNLTALYADTITLLTSGKVRATGAPNDVMTNDILSEAYDCDLRVSTPPRPGQPYLLPLKYNPAV